MRLRHIVPTLGLIAAAGTAQAVETAPGLTIGGFVDTTLDIISNNEMADQDDTLIQFTADAEVQIGYAVSEAVQLQVDVEFDDDADDVVELEQAYVAWGVNDKVTLMMGKWEGLVGYEAWDAPDLYRVNTSPVFGLNGILPVGLDVNIKGSEEFSADIYLANGVLVEDQVTDDALGVGLSLTYATETYLADFDLTYDMSGLGALGEDEAILGVNLSGEFSGMENLVVFGDIAYRDYDGENILGIMVGGNYTINEKVSASLMFSYIDDDDAIDDLALLPPGTVTGVDNIVEEMEVALAILTMPTGDENFALNFELQFLTPEDSGAEDQVGFYVEMLGIIP